MLWLSRDWHRNGRKIRMRQWKLAVLRGVAVTCAQLSFYVSLGLIAFATATTISYTMALFLTALSVPVLKETVGPVRWTAVVIGFVGVVLIVRPGTDAFALTSLLPLCAAFFYAVAAVTSRLVDDDVPTPLVNLYTQSVAFTGSLTLVLLTSGFSDLRSWADLGWIFAMGVCGGTAVLFLIYAYRMTDASNLAPFNYFGIPLAFLLGWLFFDETPFSDLFPGAILIAAGGLLIVWREQQLKRSRASN